MELPSSLDYLSKLRFDRLTNREGTSEIYRWRFKTRNLSWVEPLKPRDPNLFDTDGTIQVVK